MGLVVPFVAPVVVEQHVVPAYNNQSLELFCPAGQGSFQEEPLTMREILGGRSRRVSSEVRMVKRVLENYLGNRTREAVEKKVGQLLMPHVREKDVGYLEVGGVVLYAWANDLSSPEKVRRLSEKIQAAAEIPVIIAVDQEGGAVARLKEGGFTVFPGNGALGRTENPELAQECAKAMGEELRAVGINMNLAPVVDINGENSVIGMRAFGETADKVIRFGRQALAGFREAGVLTTLKHFPGHGDTKVDSHKALPVISEPQEGLRPFRELAKEADAVMTAHLLVPSIDEEHCITLSSKAIALLREMGFEGVIMTDSLVMEGVLQEGNVDEVAIAALKAGNDFLLLGGKVLNGETRRELSAEDVRRIHQRIVEAVLQGEISHERLDDAFRRVMELKSKILPPTELKWDEEAHCRVVKKIVCAIHKK